MNLLAFDCSTEQLSAAVQRGGAQWRVNAAGGAHASSAILDTLSSLMGRAGLALADLDAIVFGRGPGAFTGLRTACAVAQGLAYGARAHGAGVPVLPVDTLLAVAEAARLQHTRTRSVLALLDARMDEVYAAEYVFERGGSWRCVRPPLVCAPEDAPAPATPDTALAGNAFAAYGARLPAALAALQRIEALPTAPALLRLAPSLLAAGGAVPAEQALPLYIRDRVALTTAEREAAREEAAHEAEPEPAREPASETSARTVETPQELTLF